MKRLQKKVFSKKIFSRLRKIALGGNIQKSDVEITDNGKEIKLSLINEEKALHDINESWQGEYYSDESKQSQNVIGHIDYDLSDSDGKKIIYVNTMEVREEYRQTRAVKFLFDEFKKEILEPTIEKLGKEKVVLAATVVNADLEAFLTRVTEKMGITFFAYGAPYGYDDVDYDDEEDDDLIVEVNEELSNNGLEVINLGDIQVNVVSDCQIEQYIDVVKKILPRLDEVYGAIDGSADIYISRDEMIKVYNMSISFTFKNQTKEVVFDEAFEELKDMHGDEVIKSIYSTFTNSHMFRFPDCDKNFDELISSLRTT